MTESSDGTKEGCIAVPNSHHIDPSWILFSGEQSVVSEQECFPVEHVDLPENYFQKKMSGFLRTMSHLSGQQGTTEIVRSMASGFINNKTNGDTDMKLTMNNACLEGDVKRSGLEAWQATFMVTLDKIQAACAQSDAPDIDIIKELFVDVLRLNIELCFIKRAFGVQTILSPTHSQPFRHAEREFGKNSFRFERLHALANNAVVNHWEKFVPLLPNPEKAAQELRSLHRKAYEALLKDNEFSFQEGVPEQSA